MNYYSGILVQRNKTQKGKTADDIIMACSVYDDASKWRGKNILGFALMEVREVLKR